ncbi:MAG: hypothetical protein A3C43_08435 [Candidatus Schekmanbacteria bacterium RIFCSPHIGHO2_02_FULL_38_11]|uniref:CNNM transmembrane domain-containing protein n=1 Tax=Candidatus Schekmanbacteria bacterium RIFCSPLOWO2_12_FULL_38_15 TaxID=1817883 RepID=A0A1F7SE94_9BACT|nr:MAG: hypothetical protein A2043_00980 [Candidatus Schekmanbacteria bacterium GWA2_38_9]OGL48967.1 MAG: hypothetical protein A3C43_08435 [Candidatus Schekmanbacteria bacterium RIFCSPHIGHO2_02_FULL_38_11]OGL49120.1 MAG: hypothetical protein A3H37_04080 [Candidatus Schekmanbacteria bacterium RIFCSPLOWO2_02_FULL_38_14]OGL52096.1 MAG: hypothetical protein A3G31_06665 [Candidatus Schekmanbacteria bacterium RIFCSPLOWO2_12_FULL_38_15]
MIFDLSLFYITPWFDFFLAVVLAQSKMAMELLSKENIEKLLSPKQLAVGNIFLKANLFCYLI